MGHNGSANVFGIGDGAGDNTGQFLEFDGTNLTIGGALSAATGTFSGSLSAATGTFAGALSAATGSFSGEITATSGTIGGVKIATSTISVPIAPNTTGVYNNANTAFFVGADGKFSLKDKLSFDGTTLAINGGGTFSGCLLYTSPSPRD